MCSTLLFQYKSPQVLILRAIRTCTVKSLAMTYYDLPVCHAYVSSCICAIYLEGFVVHYKSMKHNRIVFTMDTFSCCVLIPNIALLLYTTIYCFLPHLHCFTPLPLPPISYLVSLTQKFSNAVCS